nr:uncharacterized protein LOC112004883 [Quercus suber]
MEENVKILSPLQKNRPVPAFFFPAFFQTATIDKLVPALFENAGIGNPIAAAQNRRFIKRCNRRPIEAFFKNAGIGSPKALGQLHPFPYGKRPVPALLKALGQRKQKREREKERSRGREGEKAGGDQVSPEGQSRRRSAFTKQQRLVLLPTTAIPPPHRQTGLDRLSRNLSRSDLSPIRQVTQDDRNLQNVNSLQRNKGSEFSCMIKEAKVLGMALGIACLDGSGSLFEVYLLLSVGKHWDC